MSFRSIATFCQPLSDVFRHPLLRHVPSDTPAVAVAEAFVQGYKGLRAEADSFADQAIARLADKPALVRLFFDRFPEVPREMAALEFVSSETGTRQEPVPGG